ncbi:MAG TPA: hypothetical protein PKC30_16540 [Saprospiraceae bacterium]|nr:hypothetical protein [Saprospiraceae bacterium]
MKLSLFITTWVILCNSFTLMGQDFVSSSSGQLLMERKYNPGAKGVTLFSEYQKGKLIDRRGNVKEDILLNLNRIMGLFMSESNGEEIVINERLYGEVVIHPNDQSMAQYTVMTFKNNLNPSDPWRYYQVLFESEDFIFAKGYESKVFSEGGSNYGKGSDTDLIKTYEYHYILDGSGFEKIRLRSKDFAAKFPHQRSLLEKMEKQNNLQLKKENDVIKLFSLVWQ